MQEQISNMRLWVGWTNLPLGSLFGISRQSFHKLMKDSYSPVKERDKGINVLLFYDLTPVRLKPIFLKDATLTDMTIKLVITIL